jgi:predicted ATPase
VLAVFTYRPEFSPAWTGHAHVTALPLNRLGRRQGAAMVERITGGKSLPTEVLDQIVARTDGVPLFIGELTKTVLESGLLSDAGDRYELSGPLPSLAIPATLHDSLMARLDRLAPVKELAQAAAVIGRDFSHGLLAAVSPMSEAALGSALDHLVSSELIFRRGTPPDAAYRFKHALVQDAAYQSLLKSRRQQLHARIAETLEQKFPDTVKSEPELLARHYTEAGSAGKAATYWQCAGEEALRKSAHPEAIAHLAKGLEVLRALPDGPERALRELNLLTTIGPALTATKGYAAPEAETAYRRALELCQELGDRAKQFSALHGLWHFHYNRADLDAARSLAEQLIDVAVGRQDPGLDLAAHRALGYTLSDLGELEASRSCLERVTTSYDPAVHGGYAFRYGASDPGVGSLARGAWGIWALGYPDQALGQNAAGIALARKLAHPLSETWALTSAAAVHQLRGEPQAAREHAEAAVGIAKERGFALWTDWASIIRGWAQGEQKASAEAIAEMRKGIDASRATGAALWTPYWLALLASVHGRIGQAREGLVATAEALTLVARTGERFWEAELQRLKGQLLLQAVPANKPEAEACFHRAIEIARSQKARSWELRAATSLARLWAEQGERQKGHDLLAPIYGWFIEGFDTADLKHAKALLDELP